MKKELVTLLNKLLRLYTQLGKLYNATNKSKKKKKKQKIDGQHKNSL